MILSRVIEHFRKQEWTAIALDFVIVVVGVFIGIQVSNWNAARANARLGEEYVERLSVDLYKDLAASRAQAAYYHEVLNAVMTTNDLLKDPDADPAALVISAYRASEIMFSAPNHATWDQIVSSGHLGLLPNDSIVGELSDYYSYDTARDVYRILGESAYRRIVRQIIPIEIQSAMRAGCSDERNDDKILLGFAEACVLDADPALIRATAEALRNEPALSRALRYQYSDVISAGLSLASAVSIVSRALSALGVPDEEIEK